MSGQRLVRLMDSVLMEEPPMVWTRLVWWWTEMKGVVQRWLMKWRNSRFAWRLRQQGTAQGLQSLLCVPQPSPDRIAAVWWKAGEDSTPPGFKVGLDRNWAEIGAQGAALTLYTNRVLPGLPSEKFPFQHLEGDVSWLDMVSGESWLDRGELHRGFRCKASVFSVSESVSWDVLQNRAATTRSNSSREYCVNWDAFIKVYIPPRLWLFGPTCSIWLWQVGLVVSSIVLELAEPVSTDLLYVHRCPIL